MREALRRALWMIPTLVVVNILAFWVTARNAPPPPGEEGVPLLFNASPTRVRTLAQRAAVLAVSDGPDAHRGEELLRRLGGAALPHLLPEFDARSPAERRRLALALLPIARRMQLPEAREVLDGEEAERLWLRVWQDHFVDFKPTITRRVVSRFKGRSTSLRQQELLLLDTYALDELLFQLDETNDVLVQRRLCAAAAHVAEKPWTIPANASAAEVRVILERWRAWWARHRFKYVQPVGVEALLGPLLETRYVLWLRETARTRFGASGTGPPAWTTLVRGAPITLSLLGLALVGGSALGLLLAAMGAALAGGRAPPFARAMAIGWLSVPLVAWFSRLPHADGRLGWAVLLVLGSAAAIALLHAESTAGAEQGGPLERALAHARSATRPTLRGMAASSSVLLGIVLLVEHGLELPGWGRETIRGLLERDLTWLMLIVLVSATLLGVVHVSVAIAQSLLGRLDQKSRREGTEHG